MTRRHAAEVTADRLVDHAERYRHLLTGEERDEVGRVIQALYEIAEGVRHG